MVVNGGLARRQSSFRPQVFSLIDDPIVIDGKGLPSMNADVGGPPVVHTFGQPSAGTNTGANRSRLYLPTPAAVAGRPCIGSEIMPPEGRCGFQPSPPAPCLDAVNAAHEPIFGSVSWYW